MRFKSITVRNYRVHREVTVPLDPMLNVIGGPNEAGKSTLLEAARYALFLKAKGGGETQKSMVSLTSQGHPEVEIEFEIAGTDYRLAKRFSGASGTAVLTQAGGSTWQAEEAEEKLSALLGVEIISGRGAGEKVEQQWAHLLVSQGRSGSSPVEYANAQRDQLFTRLQSLGGAAVMQSETDAAVAGRFRDLVDEWFTKNGEPRVGSDWGRADIAVKQAEEAATQAAAQLRKLEEAAQQHQQAEAVLASAKPELERLRTELLAVTQQLSQVKDLQQRQATQQTALLHAATTHENLQKGESEIEQLRTQVTQLREAMAPREQVLTTLKARVEETQKLVQDREGERQKLDAALREARLRVEAARTQVEWMEKSQALESLRQRVEQVKALAARQKEEEQALARLPHVDAAKLKSLRKLETEWMQAAAALQAMATGIEVLASDQLIHLGGTPLAPGESRVISSNAELAIGSGVKLRIHPGGGSSLVQAQQRAEKARAALQDDLDESGLDSVQLAVEVATQRQLKEGEIGALKAQLDGLGAGKIGRELAAAEQEEARVLAELERRRAACADLPAVADLAGARALTEATGASLRELDHQEITLKGVLDAASRAAREAAAQHERQNQAHQAEKDQLTSREAQLAQMVKMHGDDAERTARLQEAHAHRRESEEQLARTQRELTSLQPELLAGDELRLKRSLDRLTESVSQAHATREGMLILLRSEGTLDPHAAMAVADARLTEARRQREHAQRRSQAVQLLHGLFQEEQSSLTKQFTQPLAEKVSGYLQCLFGPETTVQVNLGADNKFEGLEIVRPDRQSGALGFDVLSGGAREQVAAALRLAMAEVLAAGQPDKCLPLVFDDAFAYSDPDRVRLLPRMLDLAARRGLQVIVLTCHPADYASLGAREFRLSEPAKGGWVSLAPNESTST
jgi:DNA repair exonuclease SbcCD ATPase subunit